VLILIMECNVLLLVRTNINYYIDAVYIGSSAVLQAYRGKSRKLTLWSSALFFQYFMEPEGSLPCSQESSTGLYPEPNKFSPYHPILFL
jgi:hypothetical protein